MDDQRGQTLPVRETRHTFYRICESLCGLEGTVEDERITGIRPAPEHVAT